MVIADVQQRHDTTRDAYDLAQHAWAAAFRAFRKKQDALIAAGRRYGDALTAEIEAGQALEAAHEHVRATREAWKTSTIEIGELGSSESRFDVLFRRKG